MRNIHWKARTAILLSASIILALPMVASAAEPGHGGVQGMRTEGHATAGGHDMMKMGDKVYEGKIGPWTGEARVMDMKAGMEASGMKAHGAMTNSHHVSIALTDPAGKSRVPDGKGTVAVTGPDKAKTKVPLVAMQGHFGADVHLPKPGRYTLDVEIESGGKKGSATFPYTVK